MKNTHLLPTQNNKSKLAVYHYDGSKNIKIGELALQINNNIGWTNCWSPRELYITSEEKIKDKDWCLDIDNEIVKYCEKKYNMLFHNVCKKIILTTDENLIKDGVQAIDNEFLEWWIKNPSCEEIEVKTYFKKIGVETDANGYREMDIIGKDYKIIIPKEEWISPMRPFKVKEDRSETMQRFIDNAKSHSFCETPEEKCTMNYCDDNGCMNRKRELVEPKEMIVKMMQDYEELGLYEEPNIIDKWLEENGTPEIANQVELEAEEMLLEEASEKRYPFGDGFQIMDIDISETLQLAFIKGAKWQKERSYSEEELKDIVNKTVGNFCTLFSEDLKQKVAKEWFNQFKK